MIEQITSNIVRCDACGDIIHGNSPKASLFTKDFCGHCACDILSDIGSKPLLDIEEFLQIVDDYKYSFRIQRHNTAFCDHKIGG